MRGGLAQRAQGSQRSIGRGDAITSELFYATALVCPKRISPEFPPLKKHRSRALTLPNPITRSKTPPRLCASARGLSGSGWGEQGAASSFSDRLELERVRKGQRRSKLGVGVAIGIEGRGMGFGHGKPGTATVWLRYCPNSATRFKRRMRESRPSEQDPLDPLDPPQSRFLKLTRPRRSGCPPPKAPVEETRWEFPAKLRQKVKASQSPLTRAKRSGADLRPPTSRGGRSPCAVARKVVPRNAPDFLPGLVPLPLILDTPRTFIRPSRITP